MTNILKVLYDAFDPSFMSEKERAILQEAEPVLRLAEEKLSVKEWDTLWDTARRTSGADCENLFAIGFRLGMQLTLAGMEPMGEGRI